MDASNIIFQSAKRRCYLSTAPGKAQGGSPVINLVDDDDVWDALNESEGLPSASKPTEPPKKRKRWLPDGMDPVLEELPKWTLLADVLQEIEEEMIRMEGKTSFRESLKI